MARLWREVPWARLLILKDSGWSISCRPGTEGWGETVLYDFTGAPDGAGSHAIFFCDSAGNLYGTTVRGGESAALCSDGCGTVFKLTPTATVGASAERGGAQFTS
jgi:uncharacterized repeat protein (TIGR03803 family)